jgi:outer membrane protein OmpA-like peptidoglycan-associated protein
MELFMKFKWLKLFFILISFFLVGWTNQDGAMVKAVKDGNIDKVQILLNQGVSPNLRSDHGQTLLIIAAEKGFITVAKLLLEKGADLTAVDHNGKTALLIAREKQQIAMVILLNSWGKIALQPTPLPTPIITVEPTVIPTQVPAPTKIEQETPTPTPAILPPAVTSVKPVTMIFFDFNHSDLRLDEMEKIKNILAVLKEHPTLYIILGGHADEQGAPENSLIISRIRAETVQKYFIEAGVAKDKIIVYAYGNAYPLKKGHDEESWAFNRRVDLVISDTLLSSEDMLSKTVN